MKTFLVLCKICDLEPTDRGGSEYIAAERLSPTPNEFGPISYRVLCRICALHTVVSTIGMVILIISKMPLIHEQVRWSVQLIVMFLLLGLVQIGPQLIVSLCGTLISQYTSQVMYSTLKLSLLRSSSTSIDWTGGPPCCQNHSVNPVSKSFGSSLAL
jgi:hypothetical protein